MDVFISLLLLLGAIGFACLVNRRSRFRDQEALEQELDEDFKEEFALPKASSPDENYNAMEKLVSWLEDDSERQVIEPQEDEGNAAEKIN